MTRYRAKSEKVDAFNFTEADNFPDWFNDAVANDVISYEFDTVVIRSGGCYTQVQSGDYIVRLADGTIKACGKQAFETYYEKVK